MKRYSIFICAFVLTAALMTGCGCTGPSMDQTDAPTILPTNEEVTPTTRETTVPTTEATTEATTQPTVPSESVDQGNGMLDNTTGETDTGNGAASRSMIR